MIHTRRPNILNILAVWGFGTMIWGCSPSSNPPEIRTEDEIIGTDSDTTVDETDTTVPTDSAVLAEICDGEDNDSNGEVDEQCLCQVGTVRACSDYAPLVSMNPYMRCQPGWQVCEDQTWSEECVDQIGPAQEQCNGLDDDCDGSVDDGVLNPVGQCLGTEAPLENCGATFEGNGIDDNGDGTVDEGCSCAVPGYDLNLPRKNQPCYGGAIATLGVGLCHGGKMDCGTDGTWGVCDGQVLPVAEVCGDHQDNDCDGMIDEGCPSCTNPTSEVCDGEDNDCDGIIDDDVLTACGSCEPPSQTDLCGDGLDNDCNGSIDDSLGGCESSSECYGGPPSKAGVGACKMGSRPWLEEFWGECEGDVLPVAELCGATLQGNGIDDDCDGQTDESCGCVEGAVRMCGDAGGLCEYGTQTCSNKAWGECQGGVGPATETCDGEDNDCDGLVDEELLNGCGTCGQTCYHQPFDPTAQGTSDEGINLIDAIDPDNPTGRPGITLARTSALPPYLWAANHDHDSVSKFNTDTLVDEARYWAGDNPSRTAVDLDGNMWVGCRSDGRVTKVLWDTTSCPERNGVPGIQTSTNSGAGPSQLNSAGDPFADECVVYSAVPNPARPSIRGMATGPDGMVWIGYTAGGVQGIHPTTFELTPVYYGVGEVPEYRPNPTTGVQEVTGLMTNPGGVYGLIADSNGLLYISHADDRTSTTAFDTQTRTWVGRYHGLCGSYGIAVDGQNRIWFGTYPNCGGVSMFDPAQKKMYSFTVPDGVVPSPGLVTGINYLSGNVQAQVGGHRPGGGATQFETTGVAVEPATGDVWMSFFRIGYSARLVLNQADPALSQLIMIPTLRDDAGNLLPGVGTDLRGVGFDGHGNAWTLGLNSDRVFKIDPTTNRRPPAGDPMANGISVGIGSHYTYSDFTGSTALSFTAPRGYWREVFDTGFDGAKLDTIAIEAYVPAKTTVGLRVRALDSAGVPLSGWLPAADTFEYPVGAASHTIELSSNGGPLVGHRFEVELRLTTSQRTVRPIVHDLRFGWQRP
ncbi:MAG: MopE-related protein [Myxococcota bacterium]|nr:MopE-related protein [Myxococcota bacterium]